MSFWSPCPAVRLRSVTQLVAEHQFTFYQPSTENGKRRYTGLKFPIYRKLKHIWILSSQK